jgi:hypothetical protein
MKPSGRRRVERAIRKIMEDDGDRCSICKKSFGHNIKTFGGVTGGGVPALAGECCRTKVKEVVLQGVYVNRSYDGMLQNRGAKGPTFAPEDVAGAVERLQNHFIEVDKFGNDIFKKAGLPGRTPRFHTADSPWKADDAAWFEANPGRSHRLRPMLEGEAAALFGAGSIPELPPAHEHAVIVRQVEPRKRIRITFGRNLEVPIPDVEAVIHALFDVVSSSKRGVVSTRDVAELAKRYDPGGGASGA